MVCIRIRQRIKWVKKIVVELSRTFSFEGLLSKKKKKIKLLSDRRAVGVSKFCTSCQKTNIYN